MAYKVFAHPHVIGLVAANKKITWAEGLVAYASFYHSVLMRSARLTDAVLAMNAAVGLVSTFKYVNTLERQKELEDAALDEVLRDLGIIT